MKNKKKRTKKYKGKYVTADRLDMSKGGRVGYAPGGKITMQEDGNLNNKGKGKGQNNNIIKPEQDEDKPDIIDDNKNTTDNTVTNPLVSPFSKTAKTTLSDAQRAREDRAFDTGSRTKDIATGTISLDDIGAKAEAAQVAFDPNQKIKESDSFKIQDREQRDSANYKAEGIRDETVSTQPGASQVGLREDKTAKGFTGATVSDKGFEVTGAQGNVSRQVDTSIQGTITGGLKSATVDELQIKAGRANRIEDILKPGESYLVDEVTGDDTTVSISPDAEAKTREAITDTPATGPEATQIINTIGYTAAKQRALKGTAAQGAAASLIAQVGNIPQEIAASIVEDPAKMTAQVDTNPVEVNAAIAALPTEALVSSQMENLLGGMEDGTIPLWAKPAVDAVNASMASRGLSVSTVGRDSLFNAIVQSAMPMAQSNAQALQTRAAQNLSNEQQANLQQSTQEQQLRLQNLANRQGAESQTAQMSQQMKTMQSQFNQDAVMTSSAQTQQTRMANLQNQQQAAVVKSQNQQQLNMSELGNEQQINMAELQIEAQVEGANQAAENQQRMADMQIAADFLSKNAGFKQQMDIANLSNDQQMRLANLSALNQADSESLSNEQKTELANLNKTMQTNQLQAQIASQMGLAQLNVDQQSAIQNATTNANMDLTKFNAAQQTELANSKFMQTVAITNMNAEQQSVMQRATALASMDVANLNTRERLEVANAQQFLQMDLANLNSNQQASMLAAQQTQQRLLSDQSSKNASEQFNAASQNQTDQFMTNLNSQIDLNNAARIDASSQFNAAQENAAEARRAGRDADVAKFNSQLTASIDQFQDQQTFARDSFNAQNSLVIEQSNVQWRRDIAKSDTAAQQQVNMFNSQASFNMSQTAQNNLWQEMRDEFDYAWKSSENAANRDTNIVVAGIGNEQGGLKDPTRNQRLKDFLSLIS